MINKELDKNCGAYKKKWEVVKTYTDENGDTHTVKQEWKSYDDGETWYSTDKETDTITERKDNTPIYSAVTEERCDEPDWCRFTQKIVSRDGEATWNYVGNPSKTILERNSVGHDCYVEPTPMERYRESSYTFCDDDCNYYSVKVDQKSVDGGITWENISEPETTLIESNSEYCGCFPPEPEPSISSVTVTSCTDDYTYTETLVVYEKEDGVWAVKSRETIYTQLNSPICDYELKYRWLEYDDTECINHKLYKKEKHQISYNGGTTWEDITPLDTRLVNTPIGTCDCGCTFELKTNPEATVVFEWEGGSLTKAAGENQIAVLDCEDELPNTVTSVKAIPSKENYSYSPSSVTIGCNESKELIGRYTKFKKCLSISLSIDTNVHDIYLEDFTCTLTLVNRKNASDVIPIQVKIGASTELVDEIPVAHYLCGAYEKDWLTTSEIHDICFEIELNDDISNYDFIVKFTKYRVKSMKETIDEHEVIVDSGNCETDYRPYIEYGCCYLTMNDVTKVADSELVFNMGSTEIGDIGVTIFARKPIPQELTSDDPFDIDIARSSDIKDVWQAIVGESEARIDEQDRLWNAINKLSGSTESSNNVENNER